MKGYVFDPSRLRRSPKQQERAGYVMAARMLREQLGGDPLAEARRRARSDPKIRALVEDVAADLAAAAKRIHGQTTEDAS